MKMKLDELECEGKKHLPLSARHGGASSEKPIRSLGIDLGTTFCCVAHSDGDQAKVLKIDDGYTYRSAVYIPYGLRSCFVGK